MLLPNAAGHRTSYPSYISLPSMKKIGILNGPNMSRLGKREPKIYGHATLADLEAGLRAEFAGKAQLDFYQSNHEGELVDKILAYAEAGFDGIVINPAAYTHTSVALCDALKNAAIPAVEVHISNVHSREEFRSKSYTAASCVGVIAGLGFEGYHAAVRFLLSHQASAK